MGSHLTTPLLAVGIFAIAGCGGGGGGGAGGTPFVTRNSTTIDSQTFAASVARANLFRRSNDGAMVLQITEGSMAGVSISCLDGQMQNCTVLGGANNTGTGGLTQHLQGEYAFVGNFRIDQRINGTDASAAQLVHAAALDSPVATPNLPRSNIPTSYQGQFRGSAGLTDGPNGLVGGDVVLEVNFAAGLLAARFNGGFDDNGPAISAAFNNVTINSQTGQFTSTDATVMTFQNANAGGNFDGAFYGPNGQEAAGIFNLGNETHGGMSGIFLACQNTPTCLAQD
jgi:hypothetical protein